MTNNKLEDVAHRGLTEPVTPLDILHDYRPSIARGNHFMAHRTGYTAQTLGQKLHAAGFAMVRVRKGDCFDIWARGEKAA